MSDERATDPDVLAWRVRTLEEIEAALRVELHELRDKSARRDEVYSRPEARNMFVTREEMKLAGEHRRQWPVIVASVSMALVDVVTLIIVIARLR